MEEDVIAPPEAWSQADEDGGITLAIDGVLTAQGQLEEATADAAPERNTRPRRAPGGRATHWVVSVQLDSLRPAACKSCGEIFDTGELRMCTWGERGRSRWIHPNCLRSPSAVQQITAQGASDEHHVAEARAVLDRLAASTADDEEMPERGTTDGDVGVARQVWDDNCLPDEQWWQGVVLESALKRGRGTFVQTPERYRGAVQRAREKALRVLIAAWGRGPAESEWEIF